MAFLKSSSPLQSVLKYGVLLLLIASPVLEARRLLDLQDLRPTLAGAQPKADDPDVVNADAAFERDVVGAKELLQVEEAAVTADAPMAAATATDATEIAALEEAAAAPATATEGTAEPIAIAPAAAMDGAATDAAGEAGTEDDAYWEWEDWDMPDRDSTFYAEDSMAADEATGWTWDDPDDLEGDNMWDQEWVAPEYDASLTGRVNATWNALMTHVAPQAATTAVQGKQLVRAGLSEVTGIEDHEGNDMLLETLTFLPLMPPLLLIIFLIRAATHTLTMYHLVQFACLFCAGYSGLLITAAGLTGDDPLAAFQFMAGHGPYIKYQFLVATAYTLFLCLLYINVCVQRCGGTALIQQVLGTSVGLHYYLGTFHLAMVALPPESVVGVPIGVPTYTMYLCIFVFMAVLPPRIKTEKEEEEDDKTIGEGKGQD
uniref:Uncharacterized protein n=1 Tax=Pyramimonas obovata TaxID=1411642 RepID=A0A7S0QVT4_9CHLO|mmetsp:Transcript_14626/g.31337  ORF Transcript_14626/g.31337 Transcript_14626/m.31337 type:complete len:430 (+) Transcript_14626:101-1390(+)|eukprot:CAMPEP_0118931920 /NCGR_PEP_ID=MMETSP1169-20130426/8682_1 /TAXON_ID=36882 /ORGANISM="Pyramimonas obovata, Strain CCMP722" /LENGTH=429 /DNA_ID=CAMNT_0006874497 /DNA_START=78 /DNA_END=1367 /DNA_ORIENTATION=+